jgi:hypothetical protein
MPEKTDVLNHHHKRPASTFFVRASVANNQNATAEVRGLGAQCVYGG